MEMKIEPLALPGVDTQRPIVIAGPCSAETEEQVLETAQGLASRGVKIFRAGIWKPRTKPGGFEGIGAEGLAWLKKVKKETGMLVSTEVATKDHVFEALKSRYRYPLDRSTYDGKSIRCPRDRRCVKRG